MGNRKPGPPIGRGQGIGINLYDHLIVSPYFIRAFLFTTSKAIADGLGKLSNFLQRDDFTLPLTGRSQFLEFDCSKMEFFSSAITLSTSHTI